MTKMHAKDLNHFGESHAMDHKISKIFELIALLALVSVFSTASFSQESEDAMDEFMNAPGDDGASSAPPADAGKTAVKGAVKKGAKAPPAEAGASEIVDMRGDDAKLADAPNADAAPAQPNPALDKLEALMIADAEMKVFMKAGGLRSRKIK